MSQCRTQKDSTTQKASSRKREACDVCHWRKIKCDKSFPCVQCSQSFYGLSASFLVKACTNDNDYRLSILWTYHEAKRTGSPPQQKNDAKRRWQHQEFANPSFSASQLANVFSDSLHSRSSKRKRPSGSENPVAKHARAFYLVEQGEIEFQGRSADRTFLRGLKEEIGAWPGDDTPRNLPTAFLIPGLFITERGSRCGVALPPIHRATKLVQAALDAHILLNFVHRPSFERLFHLVYSLEPSEYSSKERQFLPLLYALLAYGTLFSQQVEDAGYGEILSEAYFIQFRK